jgi:tetratricopeptide (TPR) repeat protein
LQAAVAAAQPADAQAQAIAELSARLLLMEQFVLGQRDRDVAIYRDTSKLITLFGLSFALLGMLGLSAAAYLNYRGMLAWQSAGARSSQLMPASGGAGEFGRDAVPGMERVDASRQRFQARMSSLEARLSEMEHLSGLRPAAEVTAAPVGKPPVTQSERSLSARDHGPEAVAQRPIPLATILVQKAETLASLGKHAEALAVLDEAELTGAIPVDVRLARSRVLERMGRIAEALEVCERALLDDTRSTSALLMKAGLLNRQERFADALACYEQALTLHRESA